MVSAVITDMYLQADKSGAQILLMKMACLLREGNFAMISDLQFLNRGPGVGWLEGVTMGSFILESEPHYGLF